MDLRMCEVTTYIDKLNVDLQTTFIKYSTKKWAYILHNKRYTKGDNFIEIFRRI